MSRFSKVLLLIMLMVVPLARWVKYSCAGFCDMNQLMYSGSTWLSFALILIKGAEVIVDTMSLVRMADFINCPLDLKKTSPFFTVLIDLTELELIFVKPAVLTVLSESRSFI